MLPLPLIVILEKVNIIKTFINYYHRLIFFRYFVFLSGPPAKSWTLKYYLMLRIVQCYLAGPSKLLTLKQIQKASVIRGMPLPKYCTSTSIVIPLAYQEQGGKVLQTLFDEKVNKMIGWEWYKDRYSCNEEYKGIWIQPLNTENNNSKRKTLLYLHGGGYFLVCSYFFMSIFRKKKKEVFITAFIFTFLNI